MIGPDNIVSAACQAACSGQSYTRAMQLHTDRDTVYAYISKKIEMGPPNRFCEHTKTLSVWAGSHKHAICVDILL